MRWFHDGRVQDDFVRLFYLYLARIKLESWSDDAAKEKEPAGGEKKEGKKHEGTKTS